MEEWKNVFNGKEEKKEEIKEEPKKKTEVTKRGYRIDEVISVLQKEIRRGNDEEVAFWTIELIESGLEWRFWRRIKIISLEDVGLAVPEAIVIVQNCERWYYMCRGKEEPSGDAMTAAIFASVFLSRCKKDRTVDDMQAYLFDRIKNENFRKQIPDYALDEHTKRGRELKRFGKFFWSESIRLKDPSDKYNVKYRDYFLRKYGGDS